ncbi:MAG: tol-pal system protein YbgF, partial [Desulfovibrionaceae bacterium]|nr:tol-pal system protein YbgF [Desulfovibrionaceae bacterium]
SMWSRLDDMEQNMSGMAGDLDASTSRQEELSISLQERIAKLEGELAILKANAQTSEKSRAVSQTTETEQKGTADELYKAGLKLFQERKYSLAITKLNAVIKQYPRSSLVDNAYFWLGECYYQMQDYKNAILQYEKVIRDYPKSNKAPASYLKQGLSFIRVNNIPVGKIRLNDVIDKFPKSQEATRAREELKKVANKK